VVESLPNILFLTILFLGTFASRRKILHLSKEKFVAVFFHPYKDKKIHNSVKIYK